MTAFSAMHFMVIIIIYLVTEQKCNAVSRQPIPYVYDTFITEVGKGAIY